MYTGMLTNGSDKQIAWAEKIKDRMEQRLRSEMEWNATKKAMEKFPAWLATFEALHTDAQWFIDHRDDFSVKSIINETNRQFKENRESGKTISWLFEGQDACDNNRFLTDHFELIGDAEAARKYWLEDESRVVYRADGFRVDF